MSTWAARYVLLKNRDDDLARLRARSAAEASGVAPTVYEDGTSSFAMVLVSSPSLQPDDLTELSREFGEAITLGVQTVADLFIYDHFVGGKRVRGLTYAGEEGWIRVLGDPEPWENRALFAKARLADLLAELEDDFADDELARQKAELERLWAVGKLAEGTTRPAADPLALTRAIEKHFALPSRPTK